MCRALAAVRRQELGIAQESWHDIRTWIDHRGAARAAGRRSAQAPVERGKYLVNTIMTCQNCHTPKGERGAPIFERDLSSGLSWDEPPFKVTASEHHAGQGDRHRLLERRRDQEGAAEGRAAERRAARRDHAVGFLRDPHRPATSTRSSPICKHRASR